MLTQSDFYREMGEKVREECFPDLQGLRIAWLVSDKEKKKGRTKTVCADCKKASAAYAWCCDYDYIITIYEPNVAYMTEEQLKILLEHELLHIDYEPEERMSTKPHDAEEFVQIIKKYGIDWAMPTFEGALSPAEPKERYDAEDELPGADEVWGAEE